MFRQVAPVYEEDYQLDSMRLSAVIMRLRGRKSLGGIGISFVSRRIQSRATHWVRGFFYGWMCSAPFGAARFLETGNAKPAHPAAMGLASLSGWLTPISRSFAMDGDAMGARAPKTLENEQLCLCLHHREMQVETAIAVCAEISATTALLAERSPTIAETYNGLLARLDWALVQPLPLSFSNRDQSHNLEA